MPVHMHVSGRLGNQLFQWAYAHALLARYDETIFPIYDDLHNPRVIPSEDLLIDICSHWSAPKKSNVYGIVLSVLDKIGFENKLHSRISRILNLNRTESSYELALLPVKAPRLMTGYFQNTMALEGHSDLLFQELSEKVDEIETTIFLPRDYQVLHVRRGDFEQYAQSYGLLGPEYYENNRDIDLPQVLCTDSVHGSLALISRINPEFVLGPIEASPWQVLKIMRDAKHVVMSNSTLSWWGGFLAAHNGSSVVQPSPFYRSVEGFTDQLNYRLFNLQKSVFVEP